MNCYHHPERNAVAYCCICGKALCKECSELYNQPYCAVCAWEEVRKSKRDMVIMPAIGIVVALFVVVSAVITDFEPTFGFFISVVAAGVITLCIPFGWRALNRITPDIFLIMPIFGWIIYFMIKIVISYMIGWIAAPILIHKAKQLEKTVEQCEKMR